LATNGRYSRAEGVGVSPNNSSSATDEEMPGNKNANVISMPLSNRRNKRCLFIVYILTQFSKPYHASEGAD